MDGRRFELVTLAAAQTLGSSYCSLAHGRALERYLPRDAVLSVAGGQASRVLDPAEVAVLAFARKVASDASAVTCEDVDDLRGYGLSDEDIFDIVAVTAARALFTKLLDGTGTLPDAAYRAMDEPLQRALTVGRPIADTPSATLPDGG